MINLLLAIAGTGAAAYQDWKTGFVSDKMTHFMIAFGATWALLAYPDSLMVIAIAAGVFALGFLAYIFGQLGGGDVKLFTALALLIPHYPKEAEAFSASLGLNPVSSGMPFVVSVFLLSGIIGIFFISLGYLRRLCAKRDKIEKFNSKLAKGVVYSLLVVPPLLISAQFAKAFALLFLPIALQMLVIPFKNDILKHFVVKQKPVSKLNEEDVLALEMIDEKTKKKLGLWRKTFMNRELKIIKEKARRAGIKTLPECEWLPKFVPYIFAALIISLLAGDVLLYIIMNF